MTNLDRREDRRRLRQIKLREPSPAQPLRPPRDPGFELYPRGTALVFALGLISGWLTIAVALVLIVRGTG